MAPMRGKRLERLQVMLSAEELEAIDLWRYSNMIPSRAAAVRELMRRGLFGSDAEEPAHNADTGAYGVLESDDATRPDDEEK